MPQIAREFIDPDAEKVVRRLRRSGFEAYLVGGCVRDLLLGRAPKDFDVATSATPNEIKGVFRNCRIIGRRFRLAHVFFGQKIIETSTFRANPREDGDDSGDAELMIRRDNVFGNAIEDARRRDFTMNGLFYDVEKDEVIDHVGGLADLDARLVRTIGDPEVRFPEDPVRILRALKFAARLDFDIEPATYAALLNHEHEIVQCAAPRVLEEIYRLMRGGAARRSFELLLETGISTTLAPELTAMLQGPPSFEGAADDTDEDPFAAARDLAWGVLDQLDAATARSAPPAPRAQLGLGGPAAPEPEPESHGDHDADAAAAAAAELAALSARTDLDDLERAALAMVAAGERPTPLLPPDPDERPARATLSPPLTAAGARPAEPVAPRISRTERRLALMPAAPPLSNAQLLAALVAPFLPDEPSDRPAAQYAAVESVLEPLCRRLRVARRDFERTRHLLLLVPRLLPSRKKRARSAALARRESFGEAFAVAELLARARGDDLDDLAAWKHLARRPDGEAVTDEEPADEAPGLPDEPGEAEGSPRRRRRRGGRRGRRGEVGASGTPPTSGEST